MIMEEPRTGGNEFDAVKRWAKTLDELHAIVARRFRRPEVRARARRYLASLLERVDRKNGWQMAERMGETGPQGVQRLLNWARWDAGAVRNAICALTSSNTSVSRRVACSSWTRRAS